MLFLLLLLLLLLHCTIEEYVVWATGDVVVVREGVRVYVRPRMSAWTVVRPQFILILFGYKL